MPEETFTEEEIRLAMHRLPFEFKYEEPMHLTATGEPSLVRRAVVGQLRMRQMVEYDLDDPRLKDMPKAQREMNANAVLREDLAHHMAEIVIACLKNDAETLAKYMSEGSEVLNG